MSAVSTRARRPIPLMSSRNTRSTSLPSFRRTRGLRAILVAAVALLFGAEQITAALHEATVGHAVCVEHGELVHIGGGSAAAKPATLVDTQRGSALQGDVASLEHEHCGNAGVLGSHPTLPALKEGPAPALTVLAPLGEPARYVSSTTRLLLSAPKTSPPHARG